MLTSHPTLLGGCLRAQISCLAVVLLMACTTPVEDTQPTERLVQIAPGTSLGAGCEGGELVLSWSVEPTTGVGRYELIDRNGIADQ